MNKLAEVTFKDDRTGSYCDAEIMQREGGAIIIRLKEAPEYYVEIDVIVDSVYVFVSTEDDHEPEPFLMIRDLDELRENRTAQDTEAR